MGESLSAESNRYMTQVESMIHRTHVGRAERSSAAGGCEAGNAGGLGAAAMAIARRGGNEAAQRD